jgi:prepilin-type N-terminal cleavage/methylation domain-containing protein
MVRFGRKQAGFTIIELLVCVTVIAILTGLIVVKLLNSRGIARDTSRRQDLTTYATSLEQYYAQNRTYMVKGPGCTISSNSATLFYYGALGLPTGNANNDCVGYLQGGYGSLNRKNAGNYTNTTVTIAEELRSLGMLQKIATDPRTGGSLPTGDGSQFRATDYKDFDDYILTLCTKTGTPAANPADAQEYGLYANLENPLKGSSAAAGDPAHACGGSSTTTKGWNTVEPGI